MTSKEIRQQFLDFFAGKGHAIVPSSPVVPFDDPTLMFTNAGMNQFKDVFLGVGSRQYNRAANTQKCIRAGGKHNDLDDVGRDTYHHTFFEMLGNWSFGDYFKKEAIEWAWELLTKVWGIPKERLHATYFGGLPEQGNEATRQRGNETRGRQGREAWRHRGNRTSAPTPDPRPLTPDFELDPDHEARDLWLSVTDIDPSHVHPGSMKDNFWEMGDTGPCGPCSEIHIDLTPDLSGGSLVNAGDPRVIELWNLVFIQFNRSSDGTLTPLPARHVDTGMGFERLCAVLQGIAGGEGTKASRTYPASAIDHPPEKKDPSGISAGHEGTKGEGAEPMPDAQCPMPFSLPSNYDTDVFAPLFEAVRERTGAPAYRGTLPECEGTKASRTFPASAIGHLPEKKDPSGISAGHEGTKEEGAGPMPDARCPMPVSAVDNRQLMIDVSYRVIADHVRCLTLALTDGAIPSNEGRGYVLRRILRRAVRYGRQYMNMHEPFLCDLLPVVVDQMADVFPELRNAHGGKNVEHVQEIIRDEEAAFLKTLDRGLRLVNAVIAGCHDSQQYSTRLPGYNKMSIRGIITKIFVEQGNVRVGSFGGWEDISPPEQVYDEVMQVGRLDTLISEEVLSAILRDPTVVPGRIVFTLHDTYGFPADLTQQIAEEHGLSVDISEYERLMEEARERSKSVGAKQSILRDAVSLTELGIGLTTEFVGYDRTQLKRTAVSAILRGSDVLAGLSVGESGAIVLARTPFYPEQGGQVGDTGLIRAMNDAWEFEVLTSKKEGMCILHYGVCRKGKVSSYISEEECKGIRLPKEGRLSRTYPHLWAIATVDASSRARTMKNHTSTHLLNWALRAVLGEHVQQKGSLVDPEKTRFDFSHNKPLTDEELETIEKLVNERIEWDWTVYARELPLKAAERIRGVRAVFGEKYPDPVRVVSIGKGLDGPLEQVAGQSSDAVAERLNDPQLQDYLNDPEWMKYSVEFCGGTHLKTAGEAQHFVLVSEEGVARGVRRVVGVSGEAAKQAVKTGRELLDEVTQLLEGRHDEELRITNYELRNKEAAIDDLSRLVADLQRRINEAVVPVLVRRRLQEMITELQKRAKEQEKQAAAESGEAVMDRVSEMLGAAGELDGVTIVVGEVPPAPAEKLRGAIDWVRNKTSASAVLLATVSDNKVTLLSGMSKSAVEKGLKAGDLIREVAPLVGGKGGGRPDMAQGGGTDPAGLAAALEHARRRLEQHLSDKST